MLTMNNEPSIVRTDGVVFSVTPQIAPDAIVTLSVHPVVKSPVVAESDMLARVADGETLVISGFTRDRETRERRGRRSPAAGLDAAPSSLGSAWKWSSC